MRDHVDLGVTTPPEEDCAQVGSKSMMWLGAWTRPPFLMTAGQCAMKGAEFPPSWTQLLKSRKGVLLTFAQPWPYAMNVSSAPGMMDSPSRIGRPSRV